MLGFVDMICDHSQNGGPFGLGWPKTPGNLWHLQDGRILIHYALRDLKTLLCSEKPQHDGGEAIGVGRLAGQNRLLWRCDISGVNINVADLDGFPKEERLNLYLLLSPD